MLARFIRGFCAAVSDSENGYEDGDKGGCSALFSNYGVIKFKLSMMGW